MTDQGDAAIAQSYNRSTLPTPDSRQRSRSKSLAKVPQRSRVLLVGWRKSSGGAKQWRSRWSNDRAVCAVTGAIYRRLASQNKILVADRGTFVCIGASVTRRRAAAGVELCEIALSCQHLIKRRDRNLKVWLTFVRDRGAAVCLLRVTFLLR